MTMLELEDLALAALDEAAREKGGGDVYSLADIAAEFGETEEARIRELGHRLKRRGYVQPEGAATGTHVRLLGWGSSHVEEWGLGDLLKRRRRG